MYFNVYLCSDSESIYVRNFDYINIDSNIELDVLRAQMCEIERRFLSEYDCTKYLLCIMNSDPGIKGGK